MEKEKTSIRLKKIMNIKNLKQIDILRLAEPYCKKYNVKMGSNDLSQYVTGKIEPGQNKIMILAEALNVNPSWLMGLDVPMEKEKEKNINEVLNDFLVKLKYNDIEEKVKNDKDKIIISYIDFYDILIYIYPSKLDLIEKEHTFFEQYLENIESVVEKIKNIKIKNPNIKISNNIKLEDLEDTLLSSKKNKLYYSIKKYYSKNDILKEIDRRQYFKITDKNDKPILDEDIRLNSIEGLIENILDNLKT